MPTIQTIIEEECEKFREECSYESAMEGRVFFGSFEPEDAVDFLRASLTRVAEEARREGIKEAIEAIPDKLGTLIKDDSNQNVMAVTDLKPLKKKLKLKLLSNNQTGSQP